VSRIALIPARGGSVRIRGKNIKPFFGKPIIAYSIETAQKSGLFDAVVVSTDCDAIADVAKQYGAEVFERQMDDGTRGTQDVAREVLMDHRAVNVIYACVIYPTSPLLLPGDLISADLVLANSPARYVMSVQTDPLADAGCFYYGEAYAFRRNMPLIGTLTMMYPLPPERCCDINNHYDWTRAEQLYQRLQEGKHGD
jgi:pseudaminic acid cytidylyltransferase